MPSKSGSNSRSRRAKSGRQPKRLAARTPLPPENEAVEAEVVANDENASTDPTVDVSSASEPLEIPTGADEALSAATLVQEAHEPPSDELPAPHEAAADHDRSETVAGGPLVPVDPLSRYLAEIRRFPVLSREAESEIARRYYKYHDPEDAYKLVTANLRLVVKIANEFA